MIIEVSTANGKYPVIIEKAALSAPGKYINLDRKVLVVTDSGVPKGYAEKVANCSEQSFIVTVDEGEQSKSFDTYKMVLSFMVSKRFTRSDCVVAVGGGVVGDLAGFVASSYMRGIDFYNVPTTVLSQVDSSIGGKVAIDFEGYKNIVGAFYPPKAVVIDREVLKTLPPRQISNGLAEAVKMSLTFDEELFEIFEKGSIEEYMDTILERSLLIKKNIVEKDEKESGLRKVLNFGHTLAHAIESQEGMKGWLHGECVACGMIPMCSEPVRSRLINVLKKLNLPTVIPCDSEVIREAMKHDKKISGQTITAIYVEKIGSFETKETTVEELCQSLKDGGSI